MLRTTITKIRRVCTVAFLPRAPRKPSGNFEKFSVAEVCQVQTRSKSDARDHDDDQPFIICASKKPPSNRFNNHVDQTDVINRKEDISCQVPIDDESKCNQCERLIAKAFGVDDDKSQREPIEGSPNNLEAIRLPARKYEDTDINSADAGKREDMGRSGDTIETLDTPTRVLQNIAQVNLASNKNIQFTDKRIKNSELHSSDVYNPKEETNKEIELTTLRTTTDKEDEAKFAQKVEQIDETPIIEAQKIEIEGFNVTPRTLKQDAKLNITNTKDENVSVEKIEGEKFDELASRCVNAPHDEIDKRLLKEIERLKASQADQTTQNSIYEDDVVNMNIVKNEHNTIQESNMNYEEREEEKEAADINILQRLYPTEFKDTQQEDTSSVILKSERIYTEYKPLYYEEPNEEFNEGASVGFKSIEPFKSQSLNDDVDSDRPKVHPNQVLIDPYDKSTIAHEQEESDSTYTYAHLPLREEPSEQKTNNKKTDKETEVPVEETQNEEFDPKYVVTCNETCPISTECLTCTATNTEASCLKSAEAIYDDLACSDLKKHAVEQVALENKLENNLSDSRNEHVDVESEVAGSVDKESSRSPEEEEIAAQKETEETESDQQISESSAQPDTTLTTLEKPNISKEESTNSSEKNLRVEEPIQRNLASNCTIPLPKLNDDQVSLSELLKRVRQRHRIEYCKATDIGSSAVEHLGSQGAVVEPEIGKCGKNPPPCPPPTPKCPPPDPCKPPPCPPPKPKCPKPCPPKPQCPPKKNPCAKFKKCSGFGVPNLISILLQPQFCPRLSIPITTFNINIQVIDGVIANEVSTKAVLTDEIIIKLQNLGETLFGSVQRKQLKGSVSCNFQKTTQKDRFVNKDFEPWTPIPSWPIPQKEPKRPFVCPKEGCKVVPPPKQNPPCQLDPCKNFPTRTFSLTELLIICLQRN